MARKVVHWKMREITPDWTLAVTVNGESVKVSTPRTLLNTKLVCSPSDAKVLERVLRQNGSTHTRAVDA